MSVYNPFNSDTIGETPEHDDSGLTHAFSTNPFLEEGVEDVENPELVEMFSSASQSRSQSVTSQQPEENASRASSVSSNYSYRPFVFDPSELDPNKSIAEQMFSSVAGLGTGGYVQYGSSRSSSFSSQDDDKASSASSDLNRSIASDVSTMSVVKLDDGVQHLTILQLTPTIHHRLDMYLTPEKSAEFKNTINIIKSYANPVLSGRAEDGSSKGPFKLTPEALYETFRTILTATTAECMLELLNESQTLATQLQNQPKGQAIERAIKQINPSFVKPTSAPDTPPRTMPEFGFPGYKR